jgi:hypothetical protein
MLLKTSERKGPNNTSTNNLGLGVRANVGRTASPASVANPKFLRQMAMKKEFIRGDHGVIVLLLISQF